MILSDINFDKIGIKGLPELIGYFVIEGGYLEDQLIQPRVIIEYKEGKDWLSKEFLLKDSNGNNIEWQGANSNELERNLCFKFPEHTTYFKIEFTSRCFHKCTFVQYMNDSIIEYKNGNGLFLHEN